MLRVAFSGARGVGKSTLLENLFCNLDKKANGRFTITYKDGVARDFFELCKDVGLKDLCTNTKEVCISGRLITDYLEDIYTEKEGICLYSRSLFDLYAYWNANRIMNDILCDIYGNKPLDLLVVLLADISKSSSHIRRIAQERGYEFLEFVERMRAEQEHITGAIFNYVGFNHFKKLIMLNNDYTNRTLKTNTELLTDMILKLYNEKVA